MSNTLGNYDPNFYAAQALVQLEQALGMAGRVYRGYDKNPQEYGSVINIRRPTYFTAQAMPISSANTSDINPDSVYKRGLSPLKADRKIAPRKSSTVGAWYWREVDE
jgi:hypothetical protein